MEFKELIKLAQEVQAEFERRNEKQRSVLFYFVDMVEEIGELAEILRAREFYLTQPKEKIESEIADILYDLIGIAKFFGIDMEECMKRRLDELREKFLKS